MDQIAPTITASEICDALGRKEMATKLDRTVAAVSNAASDGIFPAGWFIVVSEMCGAKGIECPQSLFSFIVPADAVSDPTTPSEEDAA